MISKKFPRSRQVTSQLFENAATNQHVPADAIQLTTVPNTTKQPHDARTSSTADLHAPSSLTQKFSPLTTPPAATQEHDDATTSPHICRSRPNPLHGQGYGQSAPNIIC